LAIRSPDVSSTLLTYWLPLRRRWVLFVGDDWAQDHHDAGIVDEAGRRLARARLPEGLEGMSRLHSLIGEHQLPQWADLEPGEAASRVKVGIGTDRGTWVAALLAAGYEVFAVNPMSVARYRERHSTSRAKSDAGDAHVLAEMVRLDRAHHRPVAADSAAAEAVKLVARTHQTLIWERSRHVLRLRSALREFFPAALEAFLDLDAPDALELLACAPGPDQAAQLSKAKIIAALRRANRRDLAAKAARIQGILRAPALRQPAVVASAYATIVVSQTRLIGALNSEIGELGEVVAAHFGRHPDAEIYASQPGLGVILAARVLAGFGDAPDRYATRGHARTTPGPPPSPAPQAGRKSSWPATSATAGSVTPCTNGPSARSKARQAPAPTIKRCGPAEPATRPPSASSPAGSPASSTAA
jgi:transposase